MAEKKYIIDNAKLMAEWNWEKNKVIPSCILKKISLECLF